MSYKRTYSHFRRRMRRTVEAIKDSVGQEGQIWEDRDGEDWGWHVTFGDGDKGVDVDLTLSDAAEYDGDEVAGWGNVHIAGAKVGGEIVFDYAPCNYTPDVWVRLAPSGWPELDERLSFIEGGVPEIADAVRKALRVAA